MLKFLLFIIPAFLFAIAPGGCRSFEERESVWVDLDFPMQTAYKLFLDGDDLYVGAGYDGLWVLDLSQETRTWEYLGHRVEDGERHFGSGVQAIDVHDGTILIRSESRTEGGRWAGIWRSSDRGRTWKPSDEGMSTERHESFFPRDFARSPHDPNRILAGSGTIYRSDDGGSLWTRVYPDMSSFRVSSLHFGLLWHPTIPDVVWAYGETNRFQPWLMRSVDAGITWERFPHINVPRDNAFFSMAIDPDRPEVIYIGAQGAVIRSLQRGADWMGAERVPPLFTNEHGGFFRAVATHPYIRGFLFAGTGPFLYVSRNYGRTVLVVETPSTYVIDLLHDTRRGFLYIAGDGGVFGLSNPTNRNL